MKIAQPTMPDTETPASLRPVFSYVDEHAPRFVAELQTFIRQPSVSMENLGVAECAELLRDMLQRIGIPATILQTSTHPMVYVDLKSRSASKTLLVTGHYDTQPVGKRDAWTADPFSGALHDGIIEGRGAADSKANVVAVVKALEALLQVTGDVPVNLKFLYDGDDEAGGRSLAGFVEQHKDLLQADDVLEVDGGLDLQGRAPVHLANCGTLNLELRARTATKDGVSIFAQLIPNAAWRLVWALSSLKAPDERVLVEGFYDDLLPATDEEERYLAAAPWSDEERLRAWGLTSFLGDVRGQAAARKLSLEPACTVSGINAGFTDRGVGRVVPGSAVAKLNFQLIANQQPDDIYRKVKAHLQKYGFGDIEVVKLSQIEPASTPIGSLISRAVLGAAPTVGLEAYALPRTYDHGKLWSWLATRIGVPGGAALVGFAQPGRNTHAPNERISVEYYLRGIKFVASIWHAYSQLSSAGG
jgi:acetylornithine deacetylase/succinyl-diaminopimelate desuccinylase-like protein